MSAAIAFTSGRALLASSIVKRFFGCEELMIDPLIAKGDSRSPRYSLRRVFERAGLSLDPDRFVQHLGFRNRGRVERGLPPRGLKRQLGVVNDAPVAAVTAQ